MGASEKNSVNVVECKMFTYEFKKLVLSNKSKVNEKLLGKEIRTQLVYSETNRSK